MPKVGKALRAYLADEIDAAAVAKRISKICPNKELQHKILDLYAAHFSTPKKTDDEIVKEEREIARGEQVLRAWVKASRAMDTLTEHAGEGTEDAIKDLVEVADSAIKALMIAEETHPDAVKKIARERHSWPMLMFIESDWQDQAIRRVRSLELGKGLEIFRTPFRTARGTDENYPARKWAKAAVRTLDETRWRFLVFSLFREEFHELVFKQGLEVAGLPEWSKSACTLPMFSKDAAREWGNAIREMIREQAPNFHNRPEWEAQRNTARHSGRDTRGEIQNAILDDIVSALRRLAPLKEAPKSTR